MCRHDMQIIVVMCRPLTRSEEYRITVWQPYLMAQAVLPQGSLFGHVYVEPSSQQNRINYLMREFVAQSPHFLVGSGWWLHVKDLTIGIYVSPITPSRLDYIDHDDNDMSTSTTTSSRSTSIPTSSCGRPLDRSPQ